MCSPDVPPLLSSMLAELESAWRNESDSRAGALEPDCEVTSTSSATATTPLASATERLYDLNRPQTRVSAIF